MTYGLCCVLKDLFQQEEKAAAYALEKGLKYNPDPFRTELAAAIERALVFATTGNPKALHKGCMGPLFLTLGILSTGFPALNNNVWCRGAIRGQYSLQSHNWPAVSRNGLMEPVSCAGSALMMHYKGVASEVSDETVH